MTADPEPLHIHRHISRRPAAVPGWWVECSRYLVLTGRPEDHGRPHYGIGWRGIPAPRTSPYR